jgi:hypothetical protein
MAGQVETAPAFGIPLVREGGRRQSLRSSFTTPSTFNAPRWSERLSLSMRNAVAPTPAVPDLVVIQGRLQRRVRDV